MITAHQCRSVCTAIIIPHFGNKFNEILSFLSAVNDIYHAGGGGRYFYARITRINSRFFEKSFIFSQSRLIF